MGIKVFLMEHINIIKIQIQYNQSVLPNKFGLLDTTEEGETFNPVLSSLLNAIPVKQSFSLVENTFSLLNYYDFIADTYIFTHLKHHFNVFILNKIPLIKRPNLRSLLTFRIANKTISHKNRAVNDDVRNTEGTLNINYNVPNYVY